MREMGEGHQLSRPSLSSPTSATLHSSYSKREPLPLVSPNVDTEPYPQTRRQAAGAQLRPRQATSPEGFAKPRTGSLGS